MRKLVISLSLLITILSCGCDNDGMYYTTVPKFSRGDIVLVKTDDETYVKGVIDTTYTFKNKHSYRVLILNKDVWVREANLTLYKQMDWTLEKTK